MHRRESHESVFASRWIVLLVAIACLSLHAIQSFGAPYGPQGKAITHKQPDGSVLELRVYGDEFYARTETLDGYTVAFNFQTRGYEYATLSKDGTEFVLSGVKPGQGNPKAAGLPEHLKIKPEARRAIARARRDKWEQDTGIRARWEAKKAAQAAYEAAKEREKDPFSKDASLQDGPQNDPPAYTTTGNKMGLVLLIDFSDTSSSISQADVEKFCNASGDPVGSNNGSVKEYFYDNSGGLLVYSNVVTAYITVSGTKDSWDDGVSDNGDQGNLLIEEAITIMTNMPGYDPSIFDDLTVDGSDRAVACNVFYAGTANGPWPVGLWPHSWSLYNVGAQELGNGFKVFKYQITDLGSSLELGTFCHENGHMLCDYPDIYDYDYDSIGGAGIYCLMNSGGHGSNPMQVNAYLKYKSGWASSIVDIDTDVYTNASLSSSGADFNRFFKLQKPGVPTEYFLLENRQDAGRDTGMNGGGILIWHIDEDGNRDDQRYAYNTSHQNYEVSLEQADNRFDFQNDTRSNDALDPYYSGNGAAGYANEFNDASGPAAKWWDGSDSGLSVQDFSTKATTMTFSIGIPGINLGIAGTTLISENLTPTNGVLDPDETVTVEFAIQNTGSQNTTNLVVTLLDQGGVTYPSAPQAYGVVPAGGGSVTQAFTFTTAGICGDTMDAVLQLQDGTNDYGNVTNAFTFGVPGGLYSFSTVTNVAIPDNNASGVDIPLVVTEDVPVTNLTVEIRLDHTYDNDLLITLIHPDSTSVVLSNRRGGSGDDFGTGNYDGTGVNTVFDDDAATAISAGAAPFAGSYQPDGSLSTLEGKSTLGTWKLRVSDNAGADLGTVYYFAINSGELGYICAEGSVSGTLSIVSSTYNVAEDGTSVDVKVHRTGGSSGAVGVDVLTRDGTATAGTDFTGKTNTLNWADGNMATQTFTVAITDNGSYQGDREFYVNLTNGTGGASLGLTETTVTIQEDEVIPGTPTGLMATPSVGQVDLVWLPASDATGYNVKRSTSQGGSYTTVGTSGTTNHTDSTVNNGTTYYYVVSGTNAAGEGANSAEVSVSLEHVLPFTETFDGAGMASTVGELNGQNGWAAGSNALVVAGVGRSGSKALALGEDSAEHSFAGGTNVVSVSIWCKPIPGEDPADVASNATAVFWVDTNLNVRVYSNTTIVTLSTQVDTNDWTHFVADVDYDAGTWQLEVDGSPAASGLGLYSAQVGFSSIGFQNTAAGSFYIDDIGVSNAVAQMTPFDYWLIDNYGTTSQDENEIVSNGVNTVREAYIIGLDPHDPDALFQVESILGNTDEATVEWLSVSGRLYNIYWSSNMQSEFQILQSNIPWTMNTFTDAVHSIEGRQRFYRIDVEIE